ncbi:MAG: cyclodeaminase/cyclohydrolase family protein [Erysipelotrichaceae bacterium]|nr:cyclodeaminase/cyclohydrolase family protein [Erysipelotrichaceae bacterium]
MKDKTLDEFTSLLGSSSPTPSGGGAAALCGALAVSLASMVTNLTTGKKKYAEHQEEYDFLIAQTEILRKSLLEQIENDAKGFEPLSKAYSLPKDDPNREQIMEECLYDAAQPPMQILLQCCEVVNILNQLKDIGSKLVLSDVACGAAMARAAIESALVNVKVNTKLMKNQQRKETLETRAENFARVYVQMAQDIYDQLTDGEQ